MQFKRKLGHIETMMATMHNEMRGTTQGVQVVLLNGNIGIDTLKKAAYFLFQKYAGLRCRVELSEGGLYLVEHGDFDLISIRNLPMSCIEEMENFEAFEVHDAIDPLHSLWRLTLISGPGRHDKRIVFVCHHVIIDANGFHSVTEDLLVFLDKIFDCLDVSFDREDMPPAIDDFLFPHTSPSYEEHTACIPIKYANYVALEYRQTHFLRSSLKAADYLLLKQKCETEKISVNSIFSAALSLAACSSGLAQSPVSFKSAVSLRNYAVAGGASKNKMGCYIAVADTALHVDGKAIKDIANEYQKNLMTYILKNCFRRKIFEYESLLISIKKMKEKTDFNGFGITNLGNVDFRMRFNNFSLLDSYVLTNRVAGNYAFALQIGEFRGGVRFIYGYAHPLVDGRCIGRISEAFNRNLLEYLTP